MPFDGRIAAHLRDADVLHQRLGARTLNVINGNERLTMPTFADISRCSALIRARNGGYPTPLHVLHLIGIFFQRVFVGCVAVRPLPASSLHKIAAQLFLAFPEWAAAMVASAVYGSR